MTPPATNTTPARTTSGRPTLSEILKPTTQAVAVAHDAALHRSMDGVRWERRGPLGRLTRSDD